MKPSQSSRLSSLAKDERDQLHFHKALSIYRQIPPAERTDTDWLEMAVIEAGLYHFKKAQKLFEQLQNSDRQEISDSASIRLLHLLIQLQQKVRAAALMDRLSQRQNMKTDPRFLLEKSLFCWEQGDLEAALNAAAGSVFYSDPAPGKSRCEAQVILGDLYSAQSDLKKAEDAYMQALKNLDAYPSNWRNVREALILNNLADLYEQFGLEESALKTYQKANDAIARTDDEEIVELDGYRMEILLSYANFFALFDQEDKALELLEQASRQVRTIPMPMHQYWKSRIDYIRGLCLLYGEKPDADPFSSLFLAWKEQEQFLAAFPYASQEYLGKAAYYAAYCYEQTADLPVSQQDLYEQALKIFEQSAYKDPKFFLFSIASIKNELASIALKTDRSEARTLYEQSRHDFLDYIRMYPDDIPARISCSAVVLNELRVSDSSSQRMRLLSLLEDQLFWLASRNEDQAIEDALSQLAGLESDDPAVEKKIEQIIRRFFKPAA